MTEPEGEKDTWRLAEGDSDGVTDSEDREVLEVDCERDTDRVTDSEDRGVLEVDCERDTDGVALGDTVPVTEGVGELLLDKDKNEAVAETVREGELVSDPVLVELGDPLAEPEPELEVDGERLIVAEREALKDGVELVEGVGPSVGHFPVTMLQLQLGQEAGGGATHSKNALETNLTSPVFPKGKGIGPHNGLSSSCLGFRRSQFPTSSKSSTYKGTNE